MSAWWSGGMLECEENSVKERPWEDAASVVSFDSR